MDVPDLRSEELIIHFELAPESTAFFVPMIMPVAVRLEELRARWTKVREWSSLSTAAIYHTVLTQKLPVLLGEVLGS